MNISRNTTGSRRGMPRRLRHTIKICELLCLPTMRFTIRYCPDNFLTMSNASDSIVQDREAGIGFAESPIIADIIETALFEDSSGYGVKFSTYFKPIPLFREKTNKERFEKHLKRLQERFEKHLKRLQERFEKHLKRLQEWTELNERVTTNIRMKLYKKLM